VGGPACENRETQWLLNKNVHVDRYGQIRPRGCSGSEPWIVDPTAGDVCVRRVAAGFAGEEGCAAAHSGASSARTREKVPGSQIMDG
jgi:hypothetical protein